MLIVGIVDYDKATVPNVEFSTKSSSATKTKIVSIFDPTKNECQIAQADKGQHFIHDYRRRKEAVLVGLGLFLSSYCLLFYSGKRFSDSSLGRLKRRNWDLGLLLLNVLLGWLGLSLMLIAPRIF